MSLCVVHAQMPVAAVASLVAERTGPGNLVSGHEIPKPPHVPDVVLGSKMVVGGNRQERRRRKKALRSARKRGR